VAHSLGAIVCRKALLMEASLEPDQSCELQLLLLAPADRANATDLRHLIDGPLKNFYALLGLGIPSLRDLSAEDLADLKEKVADAVQTSPFLIAALVLNAQFDKYVRPQPYCSDPHYPDGRARQIFDTTHSSVCKPKAADAKAYESVASCL
jgi:hypothetical protein